MKITLIRFKQTPFGGAERYMGRLKKTLESMGYETQIVSSSLPKFLPSWIRVLTFAYSSCRNKDSFYFSLDRILCPDIYRAGDGVHKAFLKTKGFSLNPLHIVLLYLEKRCFENAKVIIANSKMIRREIIEYYNINPNKIKVIYNGIPLPDKPLNKRVSKENLYKEFNIHKDKNMLLFVGSGFDRKGVKEFLEIVSKLNSDIVAFIVGKDKKLSKYKNIAKKLGIENRVIFTGPQKDVDRFYKAGDIFLFPTHYEPFSNVILEAMSYGCVPITTKTNGASEILPKESIMSSHKDIQKAATYIDNLLLNKKYLENTSKNIINTVSNLTIQKNAENTIEIIKQVSKLKN